jgi:hypothetical protein
MWQSIGNILSNSSIKHIWMLMQVHDFCLQGPSVAAPFYFPQSCAYGSCIWLFQPRHNSEQRRFTRAVGTAKQCALAFMQLEIDTIKDASAAIAFANVAELNIDE